jgi:hypothetical protein
VKNFWTPVGSGAKPKNDSDYTIATLFEGAEGLNWFDKNVSQRIQTLPGFDGITKMTDKISQIVSERSLTVN